MPDFFFKDNAELDDVSAVPPEYQPFYAQDPTSKKFVVQAPLAATAANIDGLRTNFNTSKADLTRANAELHQRRVSLEAFTGVAGVQTADELKLKLDKFTTDLAEGKKINPDTIRQELAAGFEAQVNAAKAETAGMESTLKEHLIDGQLLAAISEHKGNATILLPLARALVGVIKDQATGKYMAVGVNEKGEALPDTDGGYVKPGKVIERLKANKEYAPCFTVTPPSGGGLPPSGGPGARFVPAGGGPGNGGVTTITPQAKIQAGLAKRNAGR